MPSSPSGDSVLRAASKNDRRYITRHALGFYRALILAGLYTFTSRQETARAPVEKTVPISASALTSADHLDLKDPTTYIPALKHCIATHPILSAGIRGQDGEEPVFVRCEDIEGMGLERHLEVLDPVSAVPDVDEIEALKRVMLQAHDQVFEDVERVPPWNVSVLPLFGSDGEGRKRAYVIFAYSHSHGDGRSGLNFHRTFLEGLQRGQKDQGYDCTPFHSTSELGSLPPALEEACTLRITGKFLLSTLFGARMPEWLRGWLGFSTPIASGRTWTGKVMQYNAGNFRTGSEILLVHRDRVESVLRVCREKGGARLTGLLNQLVVRALSDVLPEHDASCAVENFIGTIVVDLRALVPTYKPEMMLNCVSAVYEGSQRVAKGDPAINLKDDDALWDAVRGTTARLAHSASTLVDQPIGLVQYLDKFRPWFLEKLGEARDSSYEISNAVVFDPSSKGNASVSGVESDGKGTWDIERMVFSQPANVTNCPLSFSVVTRKDGEMVMTLNWQIGALGVVDENGFAKDILGRIDGYLTGIAQIDSNTLDIAGLVDNE
ncbi:hypothetical protein ASPCAL01738 [Aspergillus calidoustus]|uniref:Alcohol acetyltransferase n=1 Tax=Aspergillus calidoustus TaxID=454130 RepID=A0A0U5GNC8_ASPCI|nr:hypothetical protein ASPCAL01738 [Aspergillus calidoustus]